MKASIFPDYQEVFVNIDLLPMAFRPAGFLAAGFDPCHQLPGAEGLFDVIISTHLQPQYGVEPRL